MRRLSRLFAGPANLARENWLFAATKRFQKAKNRSKIVGAVEEACSCMILEQIERFRNGRRLGLFFIRNRWFRMPGRRASAESGLPSRSRRKPV